MEREFSPIRSAEGWQLSTPSPILLASLLASLEIFEEAGWTQIQAKRHKLSQWLRFLLDELNNAQPTKILECITPRIDNGSQMSLLMLQRGREIFDALTSHGFITDWREPDVIRLAPAPLYNTYSEVWRWYDTILQTIQKDISS
jgi:kynureninase